MSVNLSFVFKSGICEQKQKRGMKSGNVKCFSSPPFTVWMFSYSDSLATHIKFLLRQLCYMYWIVSCLMTWVALSVSVTACVYWLNIMRLNFLLSCAPLSGYIQVLLIFLPMYIASVLCCLLPIVRMMRVHTQSPWTCTAVGALVLVSCFEHSPHCRVCSFLDANLIV